MSNLVRRLVGFSALLAVAGGVPAALAQPPASQPPAAGGSGGSADKDKPRDPNKPEIWPESKEIIEKELEVVRALRSIKGTVNAKWEYMVEGGPTNTTDFFIEYAAEKPDKYFYENKTFRIFIDGKTITVLSKLANERNPYNQYIQRPMPDTWRLRETIAEMTNNQVTGIMAEPLLRPGMSLDQTLRNVKTVERVRVGEFEGKQGVWVSGTAIDEREPAALPYTFEKWYSDDDRLPAIAKEDWTPMFQEMEDRQAEEDSEGQATPKKPRRFARVGWTKKFTRQLNPALSQEMFIFAPTSKDRQVDKFIFPYPGQEKHVAMIGKPAPVIKGRDFDNKDIDIASYKGKVVVLDFWGIWCSWCVKGLPSMQMIKEKYADKPFVIVGVNTDRPGDDDRVKRFLAKRNLNIQQFDDTSRGVSNALGLASFPFVMIIDQEGNIADTDVGYTYGKEKELMEKIDKLLSGKPIRTPQELQTLKDLVGTGG